MAFTLVAFTLAAVIFLYFKSNPLGHSPRFMFRRFLNWFPLGMSYAFLYMARYNLNVAKNALGTSMSVEDFGTIIGVGSGVYAVSLLVNGPLVDKIGGKRGIVIATVGASLANIAMGVVTYLYLNHQLAGNLTVVFAALYSLNMFFQSYGAVSIIKVKAYWFHVRERGLFGAIFGTLISLGVYFALDWGQAIAEASKSAMGADAGFLQQLFHTLFGTGNGSGVDAIWLVFFVPAAVLIFWAILDIWLIRDMPSQAGFEDFDTHDASSGEMDKEFSMFALVKRILTNPIIITVALIEFTTGVLRNGTLQWYLVFAKDVKQPGAEFYLGHWGLILCITGIIAGFLAGHVSDKYFHSRRAPPVAIASVAMVILSSILALVMFSSPVVVGLASVLICFLSIAVHSLMSGTAAADFGGRKATATASGITDAFVYAGTSVQSIAIGRLLIPAMGWTAWPVFMIPFAIFAVYLAVRMWHALPEATRRYLATVEKVSIATSNGARVEVTSIQATTIVEAD
jgi:OPA family glycerol-3-phosphate transporter-like MFS transporter